MDLFTLAAKIVLDTDDYETGIDKVKSGFSSLGKIAAAAVGVTSLSAFAKASIEAGMTFDSSMSQVAATMGTTVDSIQELRDTALEMGSTTSFSATEAAQGLNILAMAGLEAADQIAGIGTVLDLAAAGALSMESAASYVVGAVKGFSDSMDNAQYYADLMAKGATLANTSVNDLGLAMSQSAATAASYGQNVEGITLSLLRLADQNVAGGEAATALNRAMADLYAPTDAARAAMAELSVSAYDGSGAARDLNDVMDDLKSALSGYSAEQATAYASTIFTAQGLSAFNKMTVSSQETVQRFSDGLADAMGSAAEQAETQLDNLAGDMTLLKSAVEGAEIAISDLLTPALRTGVQGLTEIVGGAQSLIGMIDDLMPLLEGLAAGFATFKAIQAFESARAQIAMLTMDIGKANLAQAALNGTMTLWETIVALVTGKITIAQLATQLWTSAQTALSAALTANPIGAVVMAVAALVAAIVAVVAWIRKLKKETDEAAEATEELSQDVDEATQSMSAALQVEEESVSALEELRGQTLSLASANDTLSDALKEQTDSGSLSLDTALDLIDAGYAAAIAIDEETGAVTLNQKAYIELAAAKIDDQIASLETQRQSEINVQKLEQEEINVRATGSAYWEAAAAKAAASSSDNVTMLDAQIAALKRAKESLGSYTATTKTTSKFVKTQAEKDLATYKSLKSQLDHEKKMELVSEKDYYQNLATLRDNYLTDDSNLDEYQKINEQIHKYNKNLVDSISDSWEEISSLEETYQKELQSRAQEIFNSYKLFDKIPERQKVSGQELIANLQDQVSNIQEFYDNLAALSERGVGEALVEDIRSMGPSAIDQLAALLELSDDKLSEYAELYGEKQELANRYAAEGLTSLREETDEKILESLNSMESIYDEHVPEIGASFIDGLADAIMEGMQNVVGSATSVAQAAVDAVQRTLGGGLKTASVNFSDSAVGKSSAATVNAITSVATEHQADFSLNATLVAPDGTKFANYYLPSFIKQAAANGTPIAGQQYA